MPVFLFLPVVPVLCLVLVVVIQWWVHWGPPNSGRRLVLAPGLLGPITTDTELCAKFVLQARKQVDKEAG